MRDLFLLVSGWVGSWVVWHDYLLFEIHVYVPYPLLSTDTLHVSQIFHSYDRINDGHVVPVLCKGQLHFFRFYLSRLAYV